MLKGSVEIEFSEEQVLEMVTVYLRWRGGEVFEGCRVATVQRVDFEIMSGSTMTKSYRFGVIFREPRDDQVVSPPDPPVYVTVDPFGREPRL